MLTLGASVQAEIGISQLDLGLTSLDVPLLVHLACLGLPIKTENKIG
jgi:hypothetical protein